MATALGVQPDSNGNGVTPEVHRQILEENTPDPLDAVDREALLQRLPELSGILRQVPDEEQIVSLLRQAGAPVSMEEIGLTEDLIPLSAALSPYVRSRLTVMRILKLLDFTL